MSADREAEIREALELDAQWRKQEADPRNYQQGKHVYPGKVMPRHLHALAAELAAAREREEWAKGELADAREQIEWHKSTKQALMDAHEAAVRREEKLREALLYYLPALPSSAHLAGVTEDEWIDKHVRAASEGER